MKVFEFTRFAQGDYTDLLQKSWNPVKFLEAGVQFRDFSALLCESVGFF